MESEPKPSSYPNARSGKMFFHPFCRTIHLLAFMAPPLLILHKVPGADAMMPHAAQLKAFGKRFEIKIIIRGLHFGHPVSCILSARRQYETERNGAERNLCKPRVTRPKKTTRNAIDGWLHWFSIWFYSFVFMICLRIEMFSCPTRIAFGNGWLCDRIPALCTHCTSKTLPKKNTLLTVFCALGHNEPRDSHYLQFWVFTRPS